jgi:signal transduction histidine kinase
MLEGPTAYNQRLYSSDNDSTRWRSASIGLAAAVGLAYYLTARFSVSLVFQPEGVAVFWPAAGISSGILIALGPRARWPVVAGVIGATVVTHLIIKDPLWAGVALGLCNAVEALVTAGLIQLYVGAAFNLVQLRHIISLLVAAVAGTVVSGIGGAVTYRLMRGPSAPMLETFQHWFTADVIGIIAGGPLVIGVVAVVRRPSPRSEVIEGALALVALAAITGFVISLPRERWETMMPITWLSPILLWLAARCRPAFSAAGAFIVSITIVSTAILGVGHFADPSFSNSDQVLGARVAILVVALSAYVLAALFAERRESAAELAQSNRMLERERDNKLINVQAITAAIAHETRQPLTAIVANANAAQRFLSKAPPDHDEVRVALGRITKDSHRTSEVFDAIGALFRKVDQVKQPVDINEIIVKLLQSLQGELKNRGVALRLEPTSQLPLVQGNRRQLEEVILNLIQNAFEAMDGTTDRGRQLRVATELRGRGAIAVAVQDSGSGIDPKQLDNIFTAFITTKSHGMGLGLALCRMIVEHHGGQLTASSDGKSGALFEFTLPVKTLAESGGYF